MRVIAGKYKGHTIYVPKDRSIRATQDRVKEAIFSIIGTKVENALVLDLCAGAGGLGIEALSRGAEQVIFIERHTKALKRNLSQFKDNYKILEGDLRKYLNQNTIKADLIFFDPPWADTALYEFALKAIFEFDILASGGILVCEHFKKKALSELVPKCPSKSYSYGDTQLTIFKP